MGDSQHSPLAFLNIEAVPAIGSASGVDLLEDAVARAANRLLGQQSADGYWWYTLEANESINAEYILLLHYLGLDDPGTESRLAQSLLDRQATDGSWSLYFGGPGDLSTTVEAYFALKLTGVPPSDRNLTRARQFILQMGGIEQSRVFTRIHLALFGIIPWTACPAMPVGFIKMPSWSPVTIYDFSSWARATIVPMLILLDQKKERRLARNYLLELFTSANPEQNDWALPRPHNLFSYKNFYIQIDKLLSLMEQFNIRPARKSSLQACERWIREHLEKTEDIYPALAYGVMSLFALGYPLDDPTIAKALHALKRFQVGVVPIKGAGLPALPEQAPSEQSPLERSPSERTLLGNVRSGTSGSLYQQCCISPVWDTPWAGVAALEAGIDPDAPRLLKSGRWLIDRQILHTYGDWSFKSKPVYPGGWSFEFENDYFPDVDDTIQVLMFLNRLPLNTERFRMSLQRGMDWLLAMQCQNGGWAAFDVDNDSEWVNQIPFSDHGACLDPPTPDITGRAVELFAQLGYSARLPYIQKAIRFLEGHQENWGPWWGRWGVNYIYGTWCVLQGLAAIGYDMSTPRVVQAANWLKNIQNRDGGFGESCESYRHHTYIPLKESVPSQTAWALMALIAAGEGRGEAARKAARLLVRKQGKHGEWDEPHHTGTGFPGHFYIRYHGYRYYFPLLALAKYRNQFL